MDSVSISAASGSTHKDPVTGESAIQDRDPIDELLAMGVAPRLLISHQLVCMDWLAVHRRDRFCLCYFDSRDEVVTEMMGADQLLSRAQALGWRPVEEPLNPGAGRHLFEEASYNKRRGVHWYAVAHDGTEEMLPLGFPEVALKASQKRQRRRDLALARRERSFQRQVAEQAKKRAKQLIDDIAEDLLRNPSTDCPPLRTKAQAKRAARELIRDTVARLKATREDANSSGGPRRETT